MRYYRLQAFFFFILLLLYFIFTQLLYQLKTYRIHHRELAIFQRITEEKNNLLNGLEPREYVKNYEKKLQAIEKVFYGYVENISSILSEPHEWRNRIAKLKLPLPEYAGLFVGRRSTAVLKTGKDFSDIYGEDWEKSFFMGTSGGGEIFKSKVHLYSYPIEHEHFMTFKNQFQSIYKNNEFIHRYYGEKDNFSFVLLIHTSKLPEKELIKEIMNQYLSEYKNLRLSESGHDSYRREFHNIIMEESDYAFHWQGTALSYLNFISGNYAFNLVYLVFIIVLWYMGGYQIIATRFEFRFFVFFFFFTYSVYVCVLLRLESNIKNREILHLKAIEEVWRQKIEHAETHFAEFLQKKAHHLSQLFREKRNPFREKDWPEEFTAIIMRRTGFVQPQPDFAQMDGFSNNLLLRMAPALMAAQISGHNSLKNPAFETIRQKIKNDYNTEKHFHKPNKLIQTKLITDENLLMEILSPLMKEKSRASLSHLSILQKEQYIFWDKSETEPVELLIATIPAYLLQMEFFREFLKNEKKTSTQNMFIDCKIAPTFFEKSSNINLSPEQINVYWEQLQRKYGQIREIQNFHVGFFRSNNFTDFRYFFISPLNQNEGEKMRRLFEIHIWLVFFYASLISWFLRNFFTEIIAKLLKALRGWKGGEINQRISIRNRDFRARLYRSFNLFASNHENRIKALPDISPVIEEIFAGQNNKELPISHSGQAAILFCTNPETKDFIQHHEKQKKLRLFWQSKAEKYAGLLVKSSSDKSIIIFFEKVSKFYRQNALLAAAESSGESDLNIGIASGDTTLALIGNKNIVQWLYDGEVLHKSAKLSQDSQSGSCTRIFISQEIYETTRFSFDFIHNKEQDCYELKT